MLCAAQKLMRVSTSEQPLEPNHHHQQQPLVMLILQH